MREFEVQLGVAQPRTGVEKRGFGGKQLACAGFESLLRNRLCGEKLLRAVGVAFCERKTRLYFLHLRLCRSKSRLVGARINHEKKVALLDEFALLEGDFLKIAADARAQFDVRKGFETRGVVVPKFDRLVQGLCYLNRRRGTRSPRRRRYVFLAPRCECRCGGNQRDRKFTYIDVCLFHVHCRCFLNFVFPDFSKK